MGILYALVESTELRVSSRDLGVQSVLMSKCWSSKFGRALLKLKTVQNLNFNYLKTGTVDKKLILLDNNSTDAMFVHLVLLVYTLGMTSFASRNAWKV